MLDLDHPQTSHIFAAARQMDLILSCATRMSVAGGRQRTRLLDIARPAFAALRWLNSHQFQNSPVILDSINELERALERLAALATEPERGDLVCPVCGRALTETTVFTPEGRSGKDRRCSVCLDTLTPWLQRLQSSESGFGTWAI